MVGGVDHRAAPAVTLHVNSYIIDSKWHASQFLRQQAGEDREEDEGHRIREAEGLPATHPRAREGAQGTIEGQRTAFHSLEAGSQRLQRAHEDLVHQHLPGEQRALHKKE